MLAGTSASQDNCTHSGNDLFGGPNTDVMCGTSGNDRLAGRGGNDTITGGGGDDRLFGESGSDDVNGNGGRDIVSGGSDGDTVIGSSGIDEVSGEGGNDVVVGGTGFDDMDGGDGQDFVNARDGELDDEKFCGSGVDTLSMDLVDLAAASAPLTQLLVGPVRECENILVGAVREGPNVRISRRSLRVGEDGETAVRLRCPASLRKPPRCAGTLMLQLLARGSLRRSAPRTRYSLRPGRSDLIPVRLSTRDRRTMERRRRATGAATSVEPGEHGKKTTAATIRLRTR